MMTEEDLAHSDISGRIAVQQNYTTLVNVYVDLMVFTRIAGTLKTGSGRYWPYCNTK